jgi:hypothetical protein
MKSSSKFPKRIQKMLASAYLRKRTTEETATRVNDSKVAKKLGVSYNHRQIATLFGNFRRGRCTSWF